MDNNLNTNKLITNLKENIIAKLETIEQGSQEDTTLLDYILVMVVNQKTKFEMKHNLSLFLNQNTDDFVNWLFDYLAEARKSSSPPSQPAKPEVSVKVEAKVEEKPSEIVPDARPTKKEPKKKQLRSAVISKVLAPTEQPASFQKHNTVIRKRRKSFESDADVKRKVIKVDDRKESHSDSEKPDDVKENNSNTTKFYVTLNGVEDIYKDDLILLDDELDPELMSEDLPQSTGAGQTVKSNADSNADKINERCKYWPNCLNGDRCEFFHPSVKCNKFPFCGFGDKCLFIHPQCKFDPNCTRKDCAYLHTIKSRPLVKETPPVCKFYPKCMNRACEFYHPKVCHYGLACKAPYCPYAHPFAPPTHYSTAPSAIYPKRSLLKWKPNTQARINSSEIEIE